MDINMFPPNELARLLHEIGQLNTTFFPVHIIFAILAIVLLLLCYFRSSAWGNRLMKVLLAIIYAINVYGITTCAISLGGGFYAFNAAIHGAATIMLAVSVFKDDILFSLPEQKDLRILSIALTTYGIFLYPVVELLLGYRWPEIFVFGAICPTTMFVEGVLITATLNVSGSRLFKWLLGTLSTSAVIVGFRTVLIGGIFDLPYLISGIIGFYVLLKVSVSGNLNRMKKEHSLIRSST
jgi:hypothetical protein